MSQEHEMNDFFRDHFWGVIVAILLAIGSGYFSFRLTMRAFQERIINQRSHIEDLEQSVSRLQDRRESLRLDVTRMEIKINALLRDRGIDPETLSTRLEENNE